MANDKNENVLVAVFDSQGAADQAIESLKSWDKANADIKLGAIGAISLENGKVKTHVGRQLGKGAKVGAIVGVIAGVLSGGVTVIGGLLGGSLLGGVMGAFFKKSLHLTEDEIAQIGAELEGGRVAVIVTCDEHEIAPTSAELTNAGGKVRAYTVPSEAMQDAIDAVQQSAADSSEQPTSAVPTEENSSS